MAAPLTCEIDPERFLARLAAMARIGGTPRGGVHRLALTPEHARARAMLASWAAERGFSVSRDAIGNLFVRRDGGDPDARPILTGSHLDTQPMGGRLDGALGVVAAFEALEAMEDAGLCTTAPVVCVEWTAEEGGARFPIGTIGSGVFAGTRTLDEALAVRDAAGTSVGQALQSLGPEDAALLRVDRALTPAAFVELHIEQARGLERAGAPIGIVTGAQGARRFVVEVQGTEGHAGTTPREERRDALLAAVAIVSELEASFREPPDLRFTIGRFEVRPGASSVIPGRVTFSIDLRHPDDAVLTRLGDGVADACAARAGPCAVAVTELPRIRPTVFDATILDMARAAAERRGLATRDCVSGAIHDAVHLAKVCPAAMIFVRSIDGISHNEAEATRDEDLVAGAQVLCDTLVALATAPP